MKKTQCNQGQFKYPVSHICLAGTAVASWFLPQKMAGSNPFTGKTNIFVTEFSGFRETFRENSIVLSRVDIE